jgi:hypothetical protein
MRKNNNKGNHTKLPNVKITAELKAFPCGYDCREGVNRRMKNSKTQKDAIPLSQAQ